MWENELYDFFFGDPILVFSSFLLVDNDVYVYNSRSYISHNNLVFIYFCTKPLMLVLTSVIMFDKLGLMLLIVYGNVKKLKSHD
jgi:hypothetical protein